MAKVINDKLDISKAMNLEAAGDEIIKNPLSNIIPTDVDVFELPSKGKPYKSVTQDPDILSGKIKLREMKGHDEKIISTIRFIKDGSVFRRILDNCLQSDIKSEDLITTDFNYLLFALRGLSYGDDYKFTAKCQSSSCNKNFTVDCKISEIKWEEFDDTFEEPIKILLPKSKYTIECILPRQFHVELFKKEDLKDTKKKEYDTNDLTIKKYIYTTLKITDASGNELPEGKDKKNWEEFFTNLSVKDLATLRDATRFNSDIEGKEVNCPHCGETQSVSIPIGLEFFRL